MAKTKAKKVPKKRMSKGAEFPWEVWHLHVLHISQRTAKFHTFLAEFKTKKQATAHIKKYPEFIAPVVRHVGIPPMEY